MADGSLDHYRVLGLPPRAGDAEIRSAFRRLARQYHPDVNPDLHAAERFRSVVAAYEVLSDPVRRATYDAGQAGGGGAVGRQGRRVRCRRCAG